MATMHRHTRSTERAFALVDLLVGVCVLALLAALLVPMRSRQRLGDAMAEEQDLARGLMSGMAMYAEQHRDRLMPSAAHWAWCHTPYNKYSQVPFDAFDRTRRVEGSSVKVWTPHFLGWDTHNEARKIQADDATRAAFLSRPSTGSVINTYQGTPVHSYGQEARHSAFAYHPTLGMNGVYVGGAYPFGAFRGNAFDTGSWPWGNPEIGPNPRVSGGNFYVQSFARVTRPWELIMFASARGGDVATSGAFHNYGQANPDSGIIRPGYWIVRPPAAHPIGRGTRNQTYTLTQGWNASNTWEPLRVPSTWGNVAFRYNGQAVTATMDGHVQMQTIVQLRAMNKWAEMAKRPDWSFPTNPSQIWW